MDVITSRKNEKVQHMKKLGASKAYRREQGQFLCDGWKLLGEAVKIGMKIVDVLYCGGSLPEDLPGTARVYRTTREVITAVSPLSTPQDVVFSCEMGDIENIIPDGSVLIETLQDPGNVGTILRTADAFGINAVVLVGDCADPWGPKAVRASMGAIFRQKICFADIDDIRTARQSGVKIYAAALGKNCSDVREVSLKNCAVAIGNEGNGLSDELLDACDGRIIIPMSPHSESLNASVAASILMWEMRRCR